MVKALSWAVDVGGGIIVDEIDEGIDEEVAAEVSDKDELVEIEEVEEIGVAVLEVEIEAELDKEVIDDVGIAVVVKEGIAVVVSGVEATDNEAGEVEPPKVHSELSGIYSRRLNQHNPVFKIQTYTWTIVSQRQIDNGGLCRHWHSSGIGNGRHRRCQPWRIHLCRLSHISIVFIRLFCW